MGNFSGKTDTSSASATTSPQNSTDSTPKKPQGKYKVQLAASVLGGTGPFTAYHTSVLIDGRECMSFFDVLPLSIYRVHPCTITGYVVIGIPNTSNSMVGAILQTSST